MALGRVFSTDPAEKVHFVPLGPNASKVWVEVSEYDGARFGGQTQKLNSLVMQLEARWLGQMTSLFYCKKDMLVLNLLCYYASCSTL